MKKKILLSFTLILLTVSALFSSPSREAMIPINLVPSNTYRDIRYVVEPVQSTVPAETTVEEPSIDEILYSLVNLYSFIDKNALYDIDTEELQYLMVEALLKSVGDKYTYFVRPENSDAFQESSSGVYAGIGITFTKGDPEYIDPEDPETYMAIIVTPFPGSPADKAGLQPNDMISHINGEDISSLTNTEVSTKLRGTIGEPITLTIHRGSTSFDITLTPEWIETPTADGELIDGHIGYIVISEFSSSTTDNVLTQINELTSQGADSFILDLRNNGGGLVSQATQLANLFLTKGTILTTKYKEGSSRRDTLYSATSYHAVDEDVPIVLLSNDGTASASEIFIAALKDNGRAILVGEKTFGKGIVQEVIPYLNGYLNVTTASYLTPSGADIHNNGIEPDYVVETPKYTDEEEIKAYEEFMKEDKMTPWLEEHPDFTTENVDAFAEYYKDSGVPEELLRLLMANQYYYSLPYGERPLTLPDYDEQLQKAIEIINSL